MRRQVAGLAILVLVALLGATASAQAAARAFAPRFATKDTGNITLTGNTLLTCPASDAGCPAAQAGTATGSAANNNNYVMRYVNADPAAPRGVFNSSSAQLTLPAGATVLAAYLYFGADSTPGAGGAAPPNAAARNTVQLKAPGGAYTTLTAAQLDSLQTDGNDFQGVVDVTDQVQAAGAGTYWVGNVQAGTGKDRQAGWSLVVAYQDTSQPARDLTIFDGFQVVNGGNANVTIPVSGFRTPAVGPVRTELGFVAYEGDAGSTGDSVKLNTTTISDASSPANNFFNSSIAVDGAPITAKSPSYINQLGFDALLTPANGVLANGDTSAAIHLTTGGETYFPGVVTFATDLYAPKVALQKSVQDLNGGAVQAGDTLRYTVTATNSGQDDATGVTLIDPVPDGATYVPGSLRVDGASQNDGFPGTDLAGFEPAGKRAVFWVGTGAAGAQGGTLAAGGGSATVSFDVTVDAAPAGTTITNAASADFFARNLGIPLSADSNETTSTVRAPDLTVAKTPAGFTAVAGANQTFALTVTNSGDAPTDGSQVTVTDAIPAGGVFDSIRSAGGLGWTCVPATPAAAPATLSCTRTLPDALAAGASYPAINVVLRAANPLPAGPIANTATVAGGGDADTSNNADTAVGQGTTEADLQLVKTADQATALTGQQVTFTLSVHNGGPSTAQAVTVADTDLGTNYRVDDVSSSQGGCTALPCNLGALAPDADATVTVVATVTATGAGVVTADNTATVSSTTPDPTPGNNTSTASVDVAPTADLRLTKSASPDPLDTNAPATYTLTAHNDGPQTATTALVTDQLPTGFTVTSAAPSQGTCDAVSGGTLRCRLGPLATGADATITVTGTLAGSTAGTIVNNSASIASGTGDPDTSNNDASTATLALPSAELKLSKTVSDATPAAGDTVAFTLGVSNGGPTSATDVEVTDTLPSGLTLVSAPGCTAAGQALTCPVGALATGDSQTFTVTATVDAALAGQSATNTARVTSTTPDPVTADDEDTATVTVPAPTPPAPTPPPPVAPAPPVTPPSPTSPEADLGVVTTPPEDPVAGQPANYVIDVVNKGPDAATDVVVVYNVPAGLRVDSVSTSHGTCHVGASTIRCTIPRLRPHERVKITLRITPRRAGSVTDSVTVHAKTADPKRRDNTARTRFTVRAPRARVAVRKTADRAAVVAGGLVRYRIAVRTLSATAAQGIVVCDRPPAGLALIRAPGARVHAGAACWRVGRLAHGKRRSFRVLARAAATSSTHTLTNRAAVRGVNAARRRAAARVRVTPAPGPPSFTG